MKLSYQQIERKLLVLLNPEFEPGKCWIVDMFDDHFIYEEGGKHYSRAYSLVNDEVTLGEAVEVERQIDYIKVQAAVRISAAQKKGEATYGYKWRVRVVEFGTDVNGTHWTREPLVAALDIFEGAKVFMLSEAQHQEKIHPYGKPPTEIVGWLSAAAIEHDGLYADLNILTSANHLRDALVDSWERGNPDLLGLSVDLRGKAQNKTVGGKTVRYLTKVIAASVDVVYEPAAGGKFMRMAAARAGQKEDAMKLEQLLAALKTARPQAYAGIEAKIKDNTVTPEEVLGLLAAVPEMDMEALDTRIAASVKAAIKELTPAKAPPADPPADEDPLKAAGAILDQARIVACGVSLKGALAATDLPEISKAKLGKLFEGMVFEEATLTAAIVDEKEYVDKLTGSGQVSGSGDVRITQSDMEARAAMLDDFFDGKLHSFKAAYIHITGDKRVTGHLKAATRLRASVESDTWAEVLGDSIHRRMVKDYNAKSANDDWRKIVTVVPAGDFRTNHVMRMGGYGDLPIVGEGGVYTELTTPGDEESTYAVAKRGGTEDITLEAIKNDNVGVIRKIPIKLSRSARRTLRKFVLDFLRTNSTIYDSKALFHTDHNNLGTVALASASLTTRRQAMLQQTEADSSEVLGIPPKFLVVPPELDKTAYDLISGPRNSDFTPTAANFTRTLQLELIVVPEWTDATNWFLTADPDEIDTIEIAFLDGKEEPELFVQDMPGVGSMFTNDKLTWKIRQIYGGAVIDYRGMDGNVVAG